jgi:hypothetical protein
MYGRRGFVLSVYSLDRYRLNVFTGCETGCLRFRSLCTVRFSANLLLTGAKTINRYMSIKLSQASSPIAIYFEYFKNTYLTLNIHYAADQTEAHPPLSLSHHEFHRLYRID